MSETELSGPEMAAVLLLHIPEETATEFLNQLSKKEMKLLSAAIRDIGGMAQTEIDGVLESYLKEVNSRSKEISEGPAFISRVAYERFGDASAKEILAVEDYTLPETLAEIDSRTLAELLKKEHPQTSALLLAHLEPGRAAEVLALFDDELQPDIIHRLAKLQEVNPEVVEMVAEALIGELKKVGTSKGRQMGGVNVVADVLNKMDKGRDEAILTEIEDQDEDLAENVRNLMFVFEDLMFVNARGIQALLKEVERDNLVMAMKAADDGLKDHIFKNLSSRAAELIMDDMDQKGPVRLSEVESAQSEIMKTALTMVQEGRLEIDKGGDDAFV